MAQVKLKNKNDKQIEQPKRKAGRKVKQSIMLISMPNFRQNIYKTMSNKLLENWSYGDWEPAMKELRRREKLRSKKAEKN